MKGFRHRLFYWSHMFLFE